VIWPWYGSRGDVPDNWPWDSRPGMTVVETSWTTGHGILLLEMLETRGQLRRNCSSWTLLRDGLVLGSRIGLFEKGVRQSGRTLRFGEKAS
jgi:hypothetical protein